MTRRRRHLIADCPVHVIHRGNNRQRIFHCDADYLLFTRCLLEGSLLYRVDIHAYVLMTNHVHLLMTPQETGAISSMIQSVARRYVGYYNERYTRTGTLWEGRFHSSAVTTDRYFLTCHRYIDMNPVRACISRNPGDYAWSSHRHYAFGKADSMLTPHPVILGMAEDPARRQEAYRALFEEDFSENDLNQIRECAQRNAPIGEPKRKGGRPRKTCL